MNDFNFKEKMQVSKGKNVRIVIIDSGIKSEHPMLRQCKFSEQSVAIHYINDKIVMDDDINDIFGHGTAISGIFAKQVPEIEQIVIKIFDSTGLQANEKQMIAALQYVNANIDCDIIHMSLGILNPSLELQQLCKALRQKGIILVSAFDNSGAISYPAILSEVIGVDANIHCKKTDDFFIIDDSEHITVLAKGGNHRVAWIEPDFVINQGSSFSAAFVSSYIAKILSIGIPVNEVLLTLKKAAIKVITMDYKDEPDVFQLPFKIKKAAIFPYNKEMHSLINYCNELSFEIRYVCDSRYNGRIGKKVTGLESNKSFTIMNINLINWEEIDTLILGHSESLAEKDIKKELLNQCIEHKVNVYSFDDYEINEYYSLFDENNLKLYVPRIKKFDFSKAYLGKLFQIATPVIGIFGTSSKQGKFTLQLSLRKSFQELGYEVAQIGSEPSSILFDFDACFPFGYNSTVSLNNDEFIICMNWIMHKVEKNRQDADLMIVGCQSGTIPMMYNNIGQIPRQQIDFLLTLMPDISILCVNPDDDIEYIRRTIMVIEGAGNCEVAALVLYPMSYQSGWNIMNDIKFPFLETTQKCVELKSVFNKDVFVLGEMGYADRIRDRCIETLT